ncbi:MAG TPA: hypothetical protein VFD04_16675 [Actinomycetes bacterium]|jgi:hypothetical protein|nr:hypothetical protein [Actinomycetes bacterium]
MYWLYALIVAGLVAAALWDWRARRRGHRVRGNVRALTDEKYSHAGPVPGGPDSGAPPFIYDHVEHVAREDLERGERDGR